MFGGILAANCSPSRSLTFWPSLNPREEVNAWTREVLVKEARALAENSPVIAKLIEDAVTYAGVITPRPATRDTAWNALARKTFLRVVNSLNWETSGSLDWVTAQLYAERRALVDGDILAVNLTYSDGTPGIAFYESPQIKGSSDGSFAGVRCDRFGRALAYEVHGRDAKNQEVSATIPATSAVLYRHNPRPAYPRGKSALIASIIAAKDVDDINALNKQGVKNAASFSLYEVTPQGSAEATSIFEGAAAAPVADAPVTINGNRVATLAAGHDLKTVHDPRPANETRNFVHDIERQVSHGMGLDAELVHFANSLSSASTRLILQKLKRQTKLAQRTREQWANSVYRHVLACEIKAGRLRLPDRKLEPNPAAWVNVDWVNLPDMTIDVGREGKLRLDLCREGVYSLDQLALELCGLPAAEVAARNAAVISTAKKLAEKNGLTLAELMPGSVGSTQSRGDAAANPSPTPQGTEDDDPEG